MRRRHRLPLACLAVAAAVASSVLLVSSGCTVLSNDALPDDAGPFEAGPETGSTACSTCLEQACLGTWAYCLGQPKCFAIHQCRPDSRNACACTGDVQRGAYEAFATCNDEATRAACAASCAPSNTAPGSCSTQDAEAPDAADSGDGATDGGDAGDASPGRDPKPDAAVVTTSACTKCIDDTCGDTKKPCAVGSECDRYLGCAYACTDATCVTACGSRYVTGQSAASELASCTAAACSGACGL